MKRSSLGSIVDGKWVRGAQPQGVERSSQWKAWEHDRQRSEHQSELLQPYGRDGKPNPEFIEQYYDVARDAYGFVKEDV